MSDLSYLDLELSVYNPKIKNNQQLTLLCHLASQEDYKHLLHTKGTEENSRVLNSLVDIIISGFSNITKNLEKIKKEILDIKDKDISILFERLDIQQNLISKIIFEKPEQGHRLSLDQLKKELSNIRELIDEIKIRSYI